MTFSLRALEFWLSHLQSQKGTATPHILAPPWDGETRLIIVRYLCSLCRCGDDTLSFLGIPVHVTGSVPAPVRGAAAHAAAALRAALRPQLAPRAPAVAQQAAVFGGRRCLAASALLSPPSHQLAATAGRQRGAEQPRRPANCFAAGASATSGAFQFSKAGRRRDAGQQESGVGPHSRVGPRRA